MATITLVCKMFGGLSESAFAALLDAAGHTITVARFAWTKPVNAAPQIRVTRNTSGGYRAFRDMLAAEIGDSTDAAAIVKAATAIVAEHGKALGFVEPKSDSAILSHICWLYTEAGRKHTQK